VAAAPVCAQYVTPYAPPGAVWGGDSAYRYGDAWTGMACGGYRCAAGPDVRTAIRRERRFDALREEPPAPPVGLSSDRPLPPPTPDDQIQPAYRDASRIRQTFERSGDTRSK
jgi:hypothetical protein